MTEGTPVPAGYPVTYDVEPQHADRNRLTVAFRFILAIPQWIIVGGPGGSGISIGGASLGNTGNGVLGAAAAVMAII